MRKNLTYPNLMKMVRDIHPRLKFELCTPIIIGIGIRKAEDDMARKKKPVNNTPYPDSVIETFARCLWPDIQAFFESEEGKREFEIWKEEQEKKSEEKLLKNSKAQ